MQSVHVEQFTSASYMEGFKLVRWGHARQGMSFSSNMQAYSVWPLLWNPDRHSSSWPVMVSCQCWSLMFLRMGAASSGSSSCWASASRVGWMDRVCWPARRGRELLWRC